MDDLEAGGPAFGEDDQWDEWDQAPGQHQPLPPPPQQQQRQAQVSPSMQLAEPDPENSPPKPGAFAICPNHL